MLDVSDHEIVETTRLTVEQEGAEILPLDHRSVLEFVEEEILETDAQFLINERSVRPVDDVFQDSIGVVDADDVLLPLKVGEGLPQFAGDAQPINLPSDQAGRTIILVSVSEKGAEALKRTFQRPFQLQTERIFLLGKPLRAVQRLFQERRFRSLNRLPGIRVRIGIQGFHKAAVAFGRVHTVLLQDGQDGT